MPEYKPSSLLQVIRNLHHDPDVICRSLVRTALNPPRISYSALHAATLELVRFGVPLEQVEGGLRRVEKRTGHLQNLIEILRLIDEHFRELEPDYPPIEVDCHYYHIAPDIKIPFQPPPLLYYWRPEIPSVSELLA